MLDREVEIAALAGAGKTRLLGVAVSGKTNREIAQTLRRDERRMTSWQLTQYGFG